MVISVTLGSSSQVAEQLQGNLKLGYSLEGVTVRAGLTPQSFSSANVSPRD